MPGMSTFHITLDIVLKFGKAGDLQKGYENQDGNREADHLKGLDLYLGLEKYHDPHMLQLNRLSLRRVFQRLAISP